MLYKSILTFFFTVLIWLSSAIAAEPIVQLEGAKRGPIPGKSYNFGLPGYANIQANVITKPFKTEVMPSDNKRLYIEFEHKINYGGQTYDGVTIIGDNRIFLGEHNQSVLPEYGKDGLYPYVLPIDKKIVPKVGDNNISISWRKFEEHNDIFTVLEIGPFYVDGLNDPMICQVSFYTDGEIQVQYWNLTRLNSHRLENNMFYPMMERYHIGLPYVYTGGERIVLNDELKSTVYSSSPIEIFNNGKLREGWIAKEFIVGDAQFKIIDNEIDIEFGDADYAGGLLAYDFARENPVVASFDRLIVSTYSVTYGDGKDASSAVPVAFWYFQEAPNFVRRTHDANYPLFKDDPLFSFEHAENECNNCVTVNPRDNYNTTHISPATYSTSWNEYGGNVNPDTVIAPAIKIQTIGEASNRHIRLRYAAFRPRQPRSIQFFPPKTFDVKYEGDVGYMTVNGNKAPLSIIQNSSLEAVVHSSPGYIIKQVFVNDKEAFNATNPEITLSGITVDYDEFQKIAIVKTSIVPCNMTIKVIYEECSEKERILQKVIPSFVKNEVFLDPFDKSKVLETYSVKDGFGRVVQTQIPISENMFKVSALYLDEAGNTKYAPLPYVSNKAAYEYEDMFCEKCVDKSRAYFNGDTKSSKERIDSYNHPYTQTERFYGINSALIAKQAGMGEASFDLGENFAQTWRLPLKTSSSKEFFSKTQLQEVLDEKLNANGNVIENLYKERLKTITESDFKELLEENGENDSEDDPEFDYPYVLTINLSFDGIFTQSISDVAGNPMASWMTHDDEVLITRNEYDEKTTQLKSSYIEGHSGFESTYKYDDVGRLTQSIKPDRGRTEVKYDSKNRIRFTRDAKQMSKGNGDNYFSILEYDSEDRLVLTGEVRGECGGCSFSSPDVPILRDYIYPVTETIYDKPDVATIMKYDSKLDQKLIESIVENIDGILPHEAGALISYNQSGDVNTIKFSSYDNLGRVKKNWIVNLVETNAPVVENEYEYNTAGNLQYSIVRDWNYTNSSWNFVSGKSYEYDKFSRLESVSELLDDNKSSRLLAEYKRNNAGTVEETIYKDGSNTVFSKNTEHDIYGRTTNIEYTNRDGKSVYKENLKYSAPLINRVSEITHSWLMQNQNRRTFNESFKYDDLGRLAEFTTNNTGIGNATYDYDIFGRLLSKFEKDTMLTYNYVNGGYRPSSIYANGNVINKALQFDATGKVWMDGYNKTAYKLNSLGLPEKVMLYSKQLEIPSDISVEIIDNEHIYDEEYGNVNMAYDESGTRIWERTYTRGGYKGSNVTIPGIGIYSKENLAGDFKLTHLDLVGGGFRKGLAEEAIYPMVDAQGNVRAYASASGIKSAYDYRPFGRVEELEEYGVADDRRWQGKEYDGQHGKYYFGARYFDPFFGMWMSPDPAGQFANPYTYGGDPINFVDPTGLFALDLGFASIGWDSKRGWNFSLSSPIMSYTWNQNGSKTYEASVGGSYQWWIVSLGAEMGYSYNTYSGHSLSTGGHVCVGVKKGEAGVCAGVEAGGSLYWDPYGNYLGATAYAGAFAQAQTSDNSSVAKLNGGYETGLMGMEGRGLYAGGNLNAGVSLYASWAENGGWNYGGQESIYAGIGDNFGDVSANGKQKNVGYEMWIPTLGKYGRFNLGGNYDVSKQGMKNAQTEALLKYAKETKNEALAAFIQKNGIELNNKMFNELQRIVNIKTLSFPYDLSGTYDKAVVLTKSNDYPHIEFKYNQITFPEGKSSTFSSYNYGNNIFSHLAIDFIGYYMSRSVYNVSD